MRSRLVLIVLLLAGVVGLRAQEAVTLTTPIAQPSIATCHVSRMALDFDANVIAVALACNGGNGISKQYDATTTPTGATLLHNLITGNFAVNSFVKAVYNRLIADGVITGTIAGTPQ